MSVTPISQNAGSTAEQLLLDIFMGSPAYIAKSAHRLTGTFELAFLVKEVTAIHMAQCTILPAKYAGKKDGLEQMVQFLTVNPAFPPVPSPNTKPRTHPWWQRSLQLYNELAEELGIPTR